MPIFPEPRERWGYRGSCHPVALGSPKLKSEISRWIGSLLAVRLFPRLVGYTQRCSLFSLSE
jgi:hypothetical protein